MVKISKLYKDENGAGAVLCIFVLFVMLGVGGLVVDLGLAYQIKGEMRKAANAAALSGVQERLSNDQILIDGIVEHVLVEHNPDYTLADVNNICELEENNTIKVSLKQTVPTYFMKIFGINNIPIELTSRAKISHMAAGTGAMPLGVSMGSITLKSDMTWEKFLLKSSPSDTNYGKYGIISFNRTDADVNADPKREPGAKPYKDYLTTGYPGKVKVGDTLYAQSGSVAADDKIMDDKIKDSMYKSLQEVKDAYNNNTLNYNDSRIMLIIVYEEGSIIDSDKNIREITVSGFAYFYLDTYVKDGKEREINGYIIPRVFTTLGDDKATNIGSYGIRLVE